MIVLTPKNDMEKITDIGKNNVRKLSFYIFYENGAFLKKLESYLLRSVCC